MVKKKLMVYSKKRGGGGGLRMQAVQAEGAGSLENIHQEKLQRNKSPEQTGYSLSAGT